MKLIKLREYIASIFEFFILASLDILDTICLKCISKNFLCCDLCRMEIVSSSFHFCILFDIEYLHICAHGFSTTRYTIYLSFTFVTVRQLKQYLAKYMSKTQSVFKNSITRYSVLSHSQMFITVSAQRYGAVTGKIFYIYMYNKLKADTVLLFLML